LLYHLPIGKFIVLCIYISCGFMFLLVIVSRKESLEAVDFAINELKKTVPIWKKEIYESEEATWKKNAEAVIRN
jgi:molybdopterin synthase catalytic subunit